jgi:hypothetical protein
MGNKASSQSFPTEAVIAQVVKTVNTFGPLLVKGYGIAVIRKLQQLHEEEHEGGDASAEADGFLLERPPVATEPMERGWITKLGDIKKNWKRRYFVATEEADNFVVYYFEKERDAATPLKAKGSIHPCGYVVRHTTPEEDARDRKDKDASEFGLVLEPLDRKRTWVLRFDSADMRAKWRAVLQFGASRCEAPLAKDPILNDAFRDAYARTRRALGLGGYFKLDRPEKEQLALLATQACEANVLAALFDGLGSGAGGAASAGSGSSGLGSDASSSASSRAGGSGSTGSAARPASLSTGSAGGGGAAAGGGSEADKLRAAAERELERIVTAIVDSAWPAILQRVEMRRDAVEEVAETSLGAILRDEDARKTALRAALSKPVVRPAVGEIAAPVVTTVLGALLKPLYKVSARGGGAGGRPRRQQLRCPGCATETTVLRARVAACLSLFSPHACADTAALPHRWHTPPHSAAAAAGHHLTCTFRSLPCPPLAQAHKEAIKMLWHRIHDIVERGLKEDELRQFYRDTRWQSQTLGPAFRKVRGSSSGSHRVSCASAGALRHPRCWPATPCPLSLLPLQIRALTRGEVDDADSGEGALKLLSELTVSVPELEALMGGVSLYEVEMAFEDSLRQLVGWGIYSFVAAVEVRGWAARGCWLPLPPRCGPLRACHTYFAPLFNPPAPHPSTALHIAARARRRDPHRVPARRHA